MIFKKERIVDDISYLEKVVFGEEKVISFETVENGKW